MFGYVTINQPELKMREYDMYRSYYCGLCHVLKKHHGRIGQLLLNYDMTFLAMLLDSLYEEEVAQEKRRCVLHPAMPHEERICAATAYAADMTVLLAAVKARDDWKDEKNPLGLGLGAVLESSYVRLRSQYPRQAIAIEENTEQLWKLEKEHCTDIDEAAGCTGRFMAELMTYKCDQWQTDLREMGFYLGKYIYLADAYMDRKKDRKSGSYNLLIALEDQDPEGFEQFARDILLDMMARCCRAFERLPLIRNVEILRNILYAGVWGKLS